MWTQLGHLGCGVVEKGASMFFFLIILFNFFAFVFFGCLMFADGL